ncbi:4-hydroxy-2-oxovalerate aldolase [Actinomycetes bacterium NPDC127524]
MKEMITLTEVALRDGSHVLNHQYTIDQVSTIAKALNDARVPYIEVSHGDGLGGSSLQYGRSAIDELKLIEAAVSICNYSKIGVLLLPGIGTIQELNQAANLGIKMARIATHVTEADVSAQHIARSKELGLETVGFLMMAHMASTKEVCEQARLMESYGADIIYIVDSAGAMLTGEVKEKVRALRQTINAQIGFHGHNNLSLAVANTIAAIEEGARRIDGSIRCLGAGAGNAQTEVLVAVLDRMNYETGIDLYKIMDVAEEIISPLLPVPQEITKNSLTLGYAGVYSSFLLHSQRAAARYAVDQRDILMEIGKRKAVGGQEDLIMDVAANLAAKSKVMG